MAKTHPHIEAPTREQLIEVAGARPAALVAVYLGLDELIRETLPDATCSVDTVDASIGYGAHQYGYNGWGLAAVTPFGKWVSLTLLDGARLDDPAGLLTGTAVMRHVKLSDPAELDAHRREIQELILRAAALHV